MSKINKIKLSGTSYDIEDLNAPKTVELTQAQYDALVEKDPNTFYIITDAQGGDLSNYWTSAQTQSAINQATSGKQDTLSAGTGIDITDNVISATGGGGGGKAIEAGRGITVTTGATADTVSVSIPISAGTGTNSLTFGYDDVSLPQYISRAIGKYSIAGGSGCSALTEDSVALGYNNKAAGNVSYGNFAQGYMTTASGNRCHSEGLGTSSTADASHSEGHNTVASGNYSHSEGEEVNATNQCEHSQGRYNVSNKANTTWGDSGNTLFSVGNGTAENARHNAFEIRQNGDIYLSSGGTDIKLQDHLGGGGSITIDPSLDSGSTNAVANSAITNAFTAVNDNISELSANSVTNCSNVDIVDAPATPPSTIENNYVKVTWEDDYTQTYAVDYNGNIGDGDTHYGSNITKVEFGSSGFEINTFNFGFGNDDCYGLKTAIFNGDVNLENNTFSSAYQLEGVYFYAPSPSGITGVDEHFLSKVYDGCQTYEETDATYPIYVADLAAYSDAVLCYSYDLERNITWGEHFGNRLQEIPSGKKFVYNDFVTYSAATDAALSGKQDTLVSGTNIKTINNQSLLGSGNIDIQGGGGSSYTAGTGIDITNNVISVTGMVDTTTYDTYTAATDTALSNKQTTLTAGTGISIVDNVISATGGGGGGKAIEAGRGIAITTGETADTVSFNLPISANTNNSVVMGGKLVNSFTNNGKDCLMVGSELTTNNGSDCCLVVGYRNSVNGDGSAVIGWNSKSIGDSAFAFGTYVTANTSYTFATGQYSIAKNYYEASFGHYNASNTGSTDADKTLFSVGNGTADKARHNAFEIRQNGDIYCSDGTNDVKLQDTITATAANTTALGGLSLVKLTQAEYDALATKDNSTLYVIVN